VENWIVSWKALIRTIRTENASNGRFVKSVANPKFWKLYSTLRRKVQLLADKTCGQWLEVCKSLTASVKHDIFTARRRTMKDHRLIDERSLAFCRLIARKLDANPALVDTARANVKRWLATCSPGVRPALLEWQAALDGPPHAVRALLLCADERAVRLRQSNPFAGVLTPAERSAILSEFQARESAAA
jgi:hypothetical protein